MNNNVFLDTNILIRHITHDNPKLGLVATKLFDQIASNIVIAYISTLVIHEAIYVLENVYDKPKKEVVKNILHLLELENLKILDLEKDRLIAALNEYRKYSIDLPDAIYKQYALTNNLSIATFDKHFSTINAPLYLLK